MIPNDLTELKELLSCVDGLGSAFDLGDMESVVRKIAGDEITVDKLFSIVTSITNELASGAGLIPMASTAAVMLSDGLKSSIPDEAVVGDGLLQRLINRGLNGGITTSVR